jgi:hypothetical protein
MVKISLHIITQNSFRTQPGENNTFFYTFTLLQSINQARSGQSDLVLNVSIQNNSIVFSNVTTVQNTLLSYYSERCILY